MSSDGIKIGVFDRSQATAPIPEEYVNQNIWYSKNHGFFLITNENNETITDFDMPQFRRFFDKNVIHYTNNSIKAFIEKEMKDSETRAQADDYGYDDYDDGSQGYAPSYQDQNGYHDNTDYYVEDSGYDDYGNADGYAYQEDDYVAYGADEQYDYNEPEQRRRRGMRRDSSNTGQNDPNLKKKVKDPTKHMKAFFIVTFIAAVVILVLLNFAEPIVRGVAPLL